MKSQTIHQEKVEQFMKLAGQEVPDRPNEPSKEVRILRAKLIFEEAMETIMKGLGVCIGVSGSTEEMLRKITNMEFEFDAHQPFNLIETVDGCCDLKVVTTGTLSACGVHDLQCQIAVDSNNLAKFGPGSYRREDGKWIKPPGHAAPNFQQILDSQSEI